MRALGLVVVLAVSCSPHHLAPSAIEGLVGEVETEWGPCGLVRTGPTTAVTAGHCAPHSTVDASIGSHYWTGHVVMRRDLGDLAWFDAPQASRSAWVGYPSMGEHLLVLTPRDKPFRAPVNGYEPSWQAVQLRARFYPGDSGGSAWRDSGELACILTGAEVRKGWGYCELP